ncbi:MAG: type IIL restriction-modification enzyme MmeI [Opitutales bacterium]
MRDALGDGYVEALRATWKGAVPDSADFVMYWWEKAAQLLKAGKVRRFGFITTNSIHQTFNRRVLEQHMSVEAASSRLSKTSKKRQNGASTVSLAYVIPDHPWFDSADGAAVRIAMTVATRDTTFGELNRVTAEDDMNSDGEHNVELETTLGQILSNFKIGADLGSSVGLKANENLSNRGFCLFGAGFIVTPEQKAEYDAQSAPYEPSIIFDYRNGKDLTQHPRGVKVIDAYYFTVEGLRSAHPAVYQHLLTTVKPERDNNRRAIRRKNWWLFGEPNAALRKQLKGLPRYIATVETSKHRFFTFLDQSILPDNKLINFALSDAFFLGVMSSSIHMKWSLAQGGKLGVGNDPVYVKTRCFETFPFPEVAEGSALRGRIRDLGEQLDAHRKRQQTAHPHLTLTGMYNVLEKLRTVEAASSRLPKTSKKRREGASTVLTDKERKIHDDGLVSVLKQLHDDLDAAVLEAYGWQDLTVEAASSRLPNTPDKRLEGAFTGKRQDAASTAPLADRLAAGGPDAEALEQELLTRLVSLNHERAAEEKRGKIRYLRPDYQNPVKAASSRLPKHTQTEIETVEPASSRSTNTSGKRLEGASTGAQQTWPKTLPEQFTVIRQNLPTTGPHAETLAALFSKRRSEKRIAEIQAVLDTLESMGQL